MKAYVCQRQPAANAEERWFRNLFPDLCSDTEKINAGISHLQITSSGCRAHLRRGLTSLFPESPNQKGNWGLGMGKQQVSRKLEP